MKTFNRDVLREWLKLLVPSRVKTLDRYVLREWVKILTSQVALDWVRRAALGIDPMTSGWRK